MQSYPASIDANIRESLEKTLYRFQSKLDQRLWQHTHPTAVWWMAVSHTDLLANLHVFLEAVDCFPGDDGAGGTDHFTSLWDCSLPTGCQEQHLRNGIKAFCQLASQVLLVLDPYGESIRTYGKATNLNHFFVIDQIISTAPNALSVYSLKLVFRNYWLID